MPSSVQLSLMIGPIIPLTALRPVLDALAEVEVTVADVGQSGFKLTFEHWRSTTFPNSAGLRPHCEPRSIIIE